MYYAVLRIAAWPTFFFGQLGRASSSRASRFFFSVFLRRVQQWRGDSARKLLPLPNPRPPPPLLEGGEAFLEDDASYARVVPERAHASCVYGLLSFLPSTFVPCGPLPTTSKVTTPPAESTAAPLQARRFDFHRLRRPSRQAVPGHHRSVLARRTGSIAPRHNTPRCSRRPPSHSEPRCSWRRRSSGRTARHLCGCKFRARCVFWTGDAGTLARDVTLGRLLSDTV